jgi:hypothetical protein
MSGMRIVVSIVLGLGLGLACDSSPKTAPASEPSKQSAAASKAETKAETKATPAAEPPKLPPAPEGAVALDGVYVQTCQPPHDCPQLLQDAGVAHCEGLTLGSLKWRLPSIEQLEAWRGKAKLHGYDVFHWSGSPWDEDPKQLWIYDPGSGSKTTAKPDRKPFTIRCVAEPG